MADDDRAVVESKVHCIKSGMSTTLMLVLARLYWQPNFCILSHKLIPGGSRISSCSPHTIAEIAEDV